MQTSINMEGYEEECEFVEVQDSLPVRDDDLGYLLSDPNLHEYETLDDPLMEEDGVSPDIEVNDASNDEVCCYQTPIPKLFMLCEFVCVFERGKFDFCMH